MKNLIFSAFFLCFLSNFALADAVFVCTDKAGKKTWSNVRCPEDTKIEVKTVNPNVIANDGLRAWAKRSPRTIDGTAKARAAQERSLNEARLQERRQDCENARRDYSFESTWKSHRARPNEKWQIMQRVCAGL